MPASSRRYTVFFLVLILTGFINTHGQRNSTIQSEGEREASKFWSRYVAQCRGSHYVKQSHAIFIELRGFRFTLTYDRITEADRLNGVQAKGITSYTATANRYYEKGAWQSWANDLPEGLKLVNSVRFQKTGSRWIFQPVGYFDRFAQASSCDEIPGHRSSTFNERPTNAIDINDRLRMPIQEFFFWDSITNVVSDKFPQSLTAVLSWKIIFGGTAFDFSLEPVESRWYRNNIQVFETKSAHLRNLNPAQLSAGTGPTATGKWEVGSYEVKIFVRNRLVKIGRFNILNDSEFGPELRFDGMYRIIDGSDAGKSWIRFYPDGNMISSSGNFNVNQLASCMNLRAASGKPMFVGCDDFSYRRGFYTVSGRELSYTSKGSEGGSSIEAHGTIGFNQVILAFKISGSSSAPTPSRRLVFYKVDRMY